MMQKPPSLLALLALTHLALVACDKDEGTKPEPGKAVAAEPAKTEPAADPAADPAKTEPAKTEPVAAPAQVAPAVAGAPGPAFFAVDKIGVVRLDEAGFKVLEGSPGTLQHDMQLGPDGALWVLGFQDLYRLEGDRFVSKAKADYSSLGGSADHFAIAPNGDAWVTTFKGVSRWDGKAWTTEDKAGFAGDDLLQAIAVDRDNRVWVASSNRVHLREGDAWREVSLAKLKKGQLWLKDLALSPDGFVHVLIDEALIKIGPTPDVLARVNVGVKGFAQLSDVQFSLNGSIGLISYKDVYHLPAGGSPRKYSSEKARDFKADQISAIAPDDGGRLWVGSEIGVAVIVPGAPRVEWLSGSVPELVGKIADIVVFGAGPVSLPTGGPQAKGGLTGKILRDGAPVADTTIELCPSPSSFFTKTPCADAPVKFTARTDATGTWSVQDVPLGSYGLAIKNGKKWSITLMSDMGDGMKAGTVFDTGSITLGTK